MEVKQDDNLVPDVIDPILVLKNTSLFAEADFELLNLFAENSSIRNFNKEKVIFLHDDKADSFYIIVSGWVKLFRETLDGEEAIIDVIDKGHMFGETAIFENNIYAYGAQIVEDATLLVIPTSILKYQLENNPNLTMKMFEIMTSVCRQQNKELEHRDLQNASQRIGCFLLRLCKPRAKKKVRLYLPYDKMLIAARLGMKAETFSRALTRLRKNTGVNVRGATVEIDNIEKLSNYSCTSCSSTYPCQDLD